MASPTANIEIKAHCADSVRAREAATRVATKHLGVDHQVDTYFGTSRGRLKLRESSLSGGQLVPYLRPDERGPRRSDYQVIPVADPAGCKSLLSAILGVHRVVDKEREIFLCDNVRIHLDRVEGLGNFVELEAVFDGEESSVAGETEKVWRLMGELGIQEAHLVESSYEQLVEAITG